MANGKQKTEAEIKAEKKLAAVKKNPDLFDPTTGARLKSKILGFTAVNLWVNRTSSGKDAVFGKVVDPNTGNVYQIQATKIDG